VRRIVIGIALVALVAVALPARAGGADVRTLPFQMHETDLRKGNAEPSLALDSNDHVFICGPVGIPGGQFTYERSVDWVTFDHSTFTNRGGGGDCDLATGPNGTGGDAVYTANLQAWGSALNVSLDDGVTFNTTPIEDPVEQDRMWLATDPVQQGVAYLGYHDFSSSAIVVAKSLDYGSTWAIHSVASSDPAVAVEGVRNSASPGRVRVDPTDHNRVYIVWNRSTIEQQADHAQHLADDPANSSPFAPSNQILVARSDDGGLTWTDSIAVDAPPGSVLPNVIPWMALDQAGNPYVVTAGTIDGVNGLFVATSTDRGANWSKPAKVNSGAGAVVFPTVIAGKAGVADFFWIESSAPTTADKTGVWTAHFAQTRNALDAAPAFSQIDGPVVHRGEICTKGILCAAGGDRSLLDFADMALDSFGYAHIAVYSTEPGGGCDPLCPPGQASASHVLYWRQDAGPSATSEPSDSDPVTTRPGPK
jgi:hypothetical protein